MSGSDASSGLAVAGFRGLWSQVGRGSGYSNALYALQLFRGGTDRLAYLLKDRVGDLDQLLSAVVAVAEGRSVIDPQVVESLLAHGKVTQRPQLAELTEREREVLRELAQGKSNQAAAESLWISESAVEKHVSAIFAKLGLSADDVVNVHVYLPGRCSR